MRRTVITLLAALALIATPVAVSGLRAATPSAPAGAAARALPPSADRGVDTPPRSAEVVAGVAAPAADPLVALPPLLDARAARRAAALAAAERERADLLVNKRHGLPARYRPRDLVEPRVRFLAGTSDEGRLLRRRAARALERLFAAAARDGLALAGVSGFRSFASQRALFAGYARERGVENAAHVSARAGHSEHQTGLAVDIAGADGRCAASRCFAGSRAARWLGRHAAEHGFVVRYPRGGEGVTGYVHEPWHLRYVGRALAAEATATGRTLDELLPARG